MRMSFQQDRFFFIVNGLVKSLCLTGMIFLSACSLGRDQKPSVILVAIDSLSVNDINCQQDQEPARSGFSVLCNEAVRFTHAFTSSVLSQPALTSLLTGLYPIESKVRFNSGGLSAEVETVAEKARAVGYKTVFYSGGAPIWRKTGLHQGFEIFDDNVNLDLDLIFRPAEKSFSALVDFLKEEIRSAVFAVAYLPDLSFTNTETKTDYGDVRNHSFDSQLEELDESLGFLFDQLKKMKKWDSSYVVVVGLNGKTQANRSRELPPLNLFSENTQVALFIKPPTQKRDAPLQWNVDRNVSLVDVGVTLRDIFHDSEINEFTDSDFSKVFTRFSLVNVLADHQDDKLGDRWIMTETAWPQWLWNRGVRFSFRKGHFLYIQDQKLKIYNTLLDRQELNNLSRQDPTVQSSYSDFLAMSQNLSFSSWKPLEESQLDKYFLAYSLFMGPGFTKQSVGDLKTLILKRPEDADLTDWLKYGLVETKDWRGLSTFLRTQKYDQVSEWLVRKQLGLLGPLKPEGCLELLDRSMRIAEQKKKCSDSLLMDFVAWTDPGLPKERSEVLKEKWLRQIQGEMIERKIQFTNFSFSQIWDLNSHLLNGPLLVEMIFKFPEYQKYDLLLKGKVKPR